jgi:hypothetical protein
MYSEGEVSISQDTYYWWKLSYPDGVTRERYLHKGTPVEKQHLTPALHEIWRDASGNIIARPQDHETKYPLNDLSPPY